MGCSASKYKDGEAVRLCKDRRKFIKQAVEQRTRFASSHIAYLQSLKRVSLALHNFVNGEEPHDFLLDSYSTPPFTPVKRLSPEIVSVPFKSFTPPTNESEKSTVRVMRYMKSSANSSVSVEEWPQSAETVRIESYYPVNNSGIDGFFAMEASQMNSSFFPSSPYDRTSYYRPQSPQNSQWDFFWNPFTLSDSYGYPSQIPSDDEAARLRRVREEEGIPELEEDDGDDGQVGEEHEHEEDQIEEMQEEFMEVDLKAADSSGEAPKANNIKTDTVHEVKGLQSRGAGSIDVAKEQKAVELEVTRSKQEVVSNGEAAEETPGFTVYVNQRPVSMREVMKEIENQFLRICDCANEVSVMLEASRAQYSSTSTELTAIKLLNPVALFHSASSRSASSRFFLSSSSSREDAYESSSDWSEESSMVSGSHQSTLDRLYAWEKKLYEEVKCGERIRVAFEKKCTQLRNQDVNGEEPSSVYKTRASLRDLHTRLKVSIHTVESISKRIETLREEELHPQLIELIQGLARMWRTMADCHRIQKQAIDDAKLLTISTASFPTATKHSETSPPKPPRSATDLESELRNWRSAFATWIASQRSYALALASWAHRCAGSVDVGDDDDDSLPTRWSRLMEEESVGEERVVDGLDFFAAGIGSVYRVEEEAMTWKMAAEKTAELAGRVLCAGMSVAVGSLAEFAFPISRLIDNPDRLVEYSPANSCDPRAAICGTSDENGKWLCGIFDKDSFVETLEGWAKTVVTGRAKLGGIPVGIVAVETQTMTQVIPADPGQLDSHERVVPQAGQVWFPDSATKTSQALLDFNREGLPLFILANWRGFSGGQRDLFEGILQAGSTIVENLRTYNQPVFVYIPKTGELRGGAWVVVDSKINPDHIEMYAERTAKGNVLEPEGMIEIKFRAREIVECMGRLDPELIRLRESLHKTSKEKGGKDVESLQNIITAREKQLFPVYTQLAARFAELHDTSLRMKAKGVVNEVVDWENSRNFFYRRLRRRVAEEALVRVVKDAAGENVSHRSAIEMVKKWFSDALGLDKWGDDDTFFAWKCDPKNYDKYLKELRVQKVFMQLTNIGDSASDLEALPQGLSALLSKVDPSSRARLVEEIKQALD